jgi:aspartate beta-hydroxylase
MEINYECFGLNPFSTAIAKQFLTREDIASSMPHVLAWTAERSDELLYGQRAKSTLSPPSMWQRGCPEIIPGLSSRPFWLPSSDGCLIPPKIAEFVSLLESSVDDIRKEVLAVRGKRAFQEYRAPEYEVQSQLQSSQAQVDKDKVDKDITETLGKIGTDRGDWSVIYLDLHNANDVAGVDASRVLFPKTCEILSKAPRPYGHSLFSALSPGTHIPSHTGASNKKIRIHLPLIVPRLNNDSEISSSISPHCRLRVGSQCEQWLEGKCLIFDDSYQHEAWHDSVDESGGIARVVLIIDIWHPDLTDLEVKFLTFIRSSQMRQAKALSNLNLIPKQADFFAVIGQSREERSNDSKVFGDDNDNFKKVLVIDD